uniref:Uncharacterized protein n=1 Tax=Rhipicephalus zambeziensis TaxID=60191 RepID=A0A224Y935_9ACAR
MLPEVLWSARFCCVLIGAFYVDTSKLGGRKCLSLYCKAYAILYVYLLYSYRLSVKYGQTIVCFQRTLFPVTLFRSLLLFDARATLVWFFGCMLRNLFQPECYV